MESNTKLSFSLLILGTFIFNYLFWKEKLGINTLIFDIFLITCILVLGFRPLQSVWSSFFILSLFSTSVAICWHSSVFAIIMHFLSLFLIIGLIHQNGLNSLIFIISSAFVSLFKIPALLLSKLPASKTIKFKKAMKFIKLSLLPFLILWIFYMIYKNANPVFSHLSLQFFKDLSDLISPLLKNISFVHICFILFAFAINGWILFKTELPYLLIRQLKMQETLKRFRKIIPLPEKNANQHLREKAPAYYRKRFVLSLKLKYEFISALVLLILVNSLLIIVNIIDIDWVWFGFEYSEDFNMKQFVHEGTYLLILSVLLSMAIMLYFFRRNQNFYPKAKILKILAYSWIGQNLILAISVAIRNFLYIGYWGLAYKRIGVILFLIAVIYGLYSLFIKIRKTKTAYFLIRQNSLAVFAILMIASLFNWDIIIAKHNLNHPFKNHMETSYLLGLSNKTLPLFDQNAQVLEQDKKYNTYSSFEPYSYQEYYQKRVNAFINDYKQRSWKSWNYNEWKAYQYYVNKLIEKK